MSYESISAPLPIPSSPPYMRLPATGRQHEEELINAYEAEEERIMNILSRKLEQLRQEKINLERTHEEESESHVNRLARELAALRLRQQQQTPQPNHVARGDRELDGANGSSSAPNGHSAVAGPSAIRNADQFPDPSSDILLRALKKENETLRTRLVDMERDYVRLKRMNEVYREELIEHRGRLGLPVDNLIGLSSGAEREPYSQPSHLRPITTGTSASTSVASVPVPNGRPAQSVPIPRTGPQVAQSRRAAHEPGPSISSLPSISPSPSSSPSPGISPIHTGVPASYATALTTPPSSASLHASPPAPYDYVGTVPAGRILSYPSVPPPSLSSSLGSPVVSTHMPDQDQRYGSNSRRSSGSAYSSGFLTGNAANGVGERRVVESGNLRDIARSRTRSVERGGRIAETGTLARSRAGSASSLSGLGAADMGVFVPSLDETVEDDDN